ncbi:MAG: hypothetical protein B2I17_02165 [Thermoplasmatales archaeon B_DKE]|nr:MAG: hypothetical protein B2I17_02165 [Thermoplasmatales archaeon B_DKE]
MTSEKILHVYSDIRNEEQKETWEAFEQIDSVYSVEHVHALGVNDYADTIRDYWGLGHDLVIIEQDIVASPWHIRNLISCHENLCCFPYLVKSDRVDTYSIFNFTDRSKPDNWKTFDGSEYIDRVRIETKPEYCGLSGFGLTKIGLNAQKLVDFPKLYDLERWDIIDSWLSLRLYEKVGSNRIFHIHYPPVKHNHRSEKNKVDREPNSKLLVF